MLGSRPSFFYSLLFFSFFLGWSTWHSIRLQLNLFQVVGGIELRGCDRCTTKSWVFSKETNQLPKDQRSQVNHLLGKIIGFLPYGLLTTPAILVKG